MTAPASTTSSSGQKAFTGSLIVAEAATALVMLFALRSLLHRRLAIARRPKRSILGDAAPQPAAAESVALW